MSKLFTLAEYMMAPVLWINAGGPGSGCRGPHCGRPRSVTQSFKTTGGATYTIYRPSRKGMPKGQHSVKDIEKKPDSMKGQYKVATVQLDKNRWMNLEDVAGKDRMGNKTGRLASVYDAKYGRGDVYEGHGKTVFVHRDYANKRVVVHEIPHDELNKSAVAHSFKFKNFGKAAGFLNKKYGIKQKLPKLGVHAAGEEGHPKWMYYLVEHFTPEQIEGIFETVYKNHAQPFSIEDVEVDGSQVKVELKDGKKLHVVI